MATVPGCFPGKTSAVPLFPTCSPTSERCTHALPSLSLTHIHPLARSLAFAMTTHSELGRTSSIPMWLTAPAPHAQLTKLYTAEEAAAFSANGAPRAIPAARLLSLLLRCLCSAARSAGWARIRRRCGRLNAYVLIRHLHQHADRFQRQPPWQQPAVLHGHVQFAQPA